MTGLAVPMGVAFVAGVAAAVSDLRRFRVANALTLGLLASGLIYHSVAGGWRGLGLGLGGAGFGFAALLLPYALGGMAAGDVKLLAGLGAWLGPPLTYEVLIASALLGGVYALAVAIAAGRLRQTLADVRALVRRGLRPAEETVQHVLAGSDRRSRLVPFGAMLALGVVATAVRLA